MNTCESRRMCVREPKRAGPEGARALWQQTHRAQESGDEGLQT
jgi:hypothetical protein